MTGQDTTTGQQHSPTATPSFLDRDAVVKALWDAMYNPDGLYPMERAHPEERDVIPPLADAVMALNQHYANGAPTPAPSVVTTVDELEAEVEGRYPMTDYGRTLAEVNWLEGQRAGFKAGASWAGGLVGLQGDDVAAVIAKHILDEYANTCSCKKWEHWEDDYDVRIAGYAHHVAAAIIAKAGVR